MKPLAIDLFCGIGGWADGFLAEGWDIIGFDIVKRKRKKYPGIFVQQDVSTLDGKRFAGAVVILASPPCQAWSYAMVSYNNKLAAHRAVTAPFDMRLVMAAFRIAREAGVPLVLENVRGAIPLIGEPKGSFGPYFLWGNGVPPSLPYATRLDSWKGRHRSPLLRAKIPFELARAVARFWKNPPLALPLRGLGGGQPPTCLLYRR
jgi:hypothetical protein